MQGPKVPAVGSRGKTCKRQTHMVEVRFEPPNPGGVRCEASIHQATLSLLLAGGGVNG